MEQDRIMFDELRKSKDWNEAIIVFKNESFDGRRQYSEEERSYKISSKAKYFDPTMIGRSLVGNCLDGKDLGVRLDQYMHRAPSDGKKWEIEYCYILN